MTDQQNVPTSPPAAPPATPPPATTPPATPPPAPPTSTGPSTSMFAGVSQGELLILAGSALILLGDFVFGIFGDYSYSAVVWVAAVLSLILVLTHNRPQMGMDVPAGGYRIGLILLGGLAFLAGIRYLLLDAIYVPGRNLSLTYFLGALVFYVAVGLMSVGAFMVWRRRS
jgi:hypothetical protein